MIIQTTGDRVLDSPLSRIGGKGVFTKEIEEALLDGRIDAAVHSLKDLPTRQPEGLALGAITKREDPADVLIAAWPVNWKTLGADRRIGTSSLRRRAQLRLRNQDVEIAELRGNVPTRVQKALDGEYDAIVLAAAGLGRLGITPTHCARIPFDEMLPAPGQGALGLQIRANDEETRALIAVLHDGDAAACCTAERALLEALGGGCQLPLGALGEIAGGRLRLRGRVVSLDGGDVVEDVIEGATSAPEALGRELGARLLAAGADRILASVTRDAGQQEEARAADERLPLHGRIVIVTREEDSDGPLSVALRAQGAQPVCLPLVQHLPPADPAPLKKAIASIQLYDWIVLTSSRGVEALEAGLKEAGMRAGGTKARVACVGAATARAAEDAGWRVSLIPQDSQVAGLLEAILGTGPAAGARFLYPRADRAATTITDGLRAAGMIVDDPAAYRTEPVAAGSVVVESWRTRRPDAVLFCSASAVETIAESFSAAERLEVFRGVVIGSIGPRTSDALRHIGVEPQFEAEERSFEGLADALAKYYSRRPQS